MKGPKNTITVFGSVAFIFLTQGYVAIIDSEDVKLVEKFKWHAVSLKHSKTVYVAHNSRKEGTVLLHRFLHNLTDPNIQIDHRNNCGLDNRRNNLRLASDSENKQNKNKRSDNKSGYLGVHLHKCGKYVAQVQKSGSTKFYAGLYVTPEEAAKARDILALKVCDPSFIVLNFPKDLNESYSTRA